MQSRLLEPYEVLLRLYGKAEGEFTKMDPGSHGIRATLRTEVE